MSAGKHTLIEQLERVLLNEDEGTPEDRRDRRMWNAGARAVIAIARDYNPRVVAGLHELAAATPIVRPREFDLSDQRCIDWPACDRACERGLG